MLYFVIEKAGRDPKRQTLSNQGAQNRASKQLDRQITEDSKINL